MVATVAVAAAAQVAALDSGDLTIYPGNYTLLFDSGADGEVVSAPFTLTGKSVVVERFPAAE